jgi:ribosomal protein S6
MVFYTFTLVMRPRNHAITAKAIKEFSLEIYNSGGTIRRISNEGMFRPYKRFRDEKGMLHSTCRYWTIQCDISDSQERQMRKLWADHPDVLRALAVAAEQEHRVSFKGEFPLDTFVRYEEELNWPPQVSANAVEQMDMNWKEFQRNRWSAFLRS